MKKFRALIAVLYVGNQLIDPARWKDWQLWVSLLVAAAGVLEAFGAGILFSESDATGFVLTIAGLLNAFVTVGTTKKIGLPDNSEKESE